MTPKERAEELLDKMILDWSCDECHNHWAKKCALIAVYEIIEECGNWTGGTNYDDWDSKRFHYWQEVKKEIENL